MDARDMLDMRFLKKSSYVSRKIADELIMVPIRQRAGEIDSIYAMNEVAGRVWELLDGRKSVREICDVIVEEYEVSQDEAEQDVTGFLLQLEEISAIEVA
jgi:hypothetical protein